MKLSEIRNIKESVMSDISVEAQETLMKKFGFSDGDAEDALNFAIGETDWSELSDEAREKLYSWAEKSAPTGFDKSNNTDPTKFIRPALVGMLGLPT